jgi:hypothetical protein
MITLWFWTAAVWTSGLLVGVALASALTLNKEPPASAGQEDEVIIAEQVTVRVEEIPAEEDEVDGGESFADVVRN